MTRTKVAIACQGGGSQTAFTAGALKGLIEAYRKDLFEVVSISGTSGGAVCASLLWYGFLKGDKPIWQRLEAFWKDNTAQGWVEENLNKTIVDGMRMINRGMMPALQLSPSSPWMQMMMPWLTLGSRSTFTGFPELLRKYIDFDEIARWGVRTERPILLVGAANVTTGRLAKFSSNKEPIRIEHILASCAVPTIFPAVMIDGQGYWDGLFSDNPPIEDLMRPRTVGDGNVPDEIWLIKINPTGRLVVPAESNDITDRRNQMEGNISLFHQLDHIEMINDMIAADAFRPQFLAQFDVRHPIRIPKAFESDPDKPYHIPCIEMPQDMQDRLDYEGKIDRSAANIDWLMQQGEVVARAFIADRAAVAEAAPKTAKPRKG
jgi:NTE family protein